MHFCWFFKVFYRFLFSFNRFFNKFDWFELISIDFDRFLLFFNNFLDFYSSFNEFLLIFADFLKFYCFLKWIHIVFKWYFVLAIMSDWRFVAFRIDWRLTLNRVMRGLQNLFAHAQDTVPILNTNWRWTVNRKGPPEPEGSIKTKNRCCNDTNPWMKHGAENLLQ